MWRVWEREEKDVGKGVKRAKNCVTEKNLKIVLRSLMENQSECFLQKEFRLYKNYLWSLIISMIIIVYTANYFPFPPIYPFVALFILTSGIFIQYMLPNHKPRTIKEHFNHMVNHPMDEKFLFLFKAIIIDWTMDKQLQEENIMDWIEHPNCESERYKDLMLKYGVSDNRKLFILFFLEHLRYVPTFPTNIQHMGYF